MKLFRAEVYEKIVAIDNLERGIEEALVQIVRDEKLQAVLRSYAKKNEISHKGFGEYGSGIREYCGGNNTFRDRRIIFWSRPSPSCEKRKDELYLGPDPQKEVMPMYLRYWVLKDETDQFAPEYTYWNLELTQKKPGKFYVEKPKFSTIAMERRTEIAGRRVIDVPFWQELPPKVFMDGLEKAIAKLIKS